VLLGLITMAFIAGGVSGALAMTFATAPPRHCATCRSHGEPLPTYVPEARPPTPALDSDVPPSRRSAHRPSGTAATASA
jgi:hypothetical protein